MGTVPFIVTDLRTENTETSIFSDAQREWLYNELSQARTYDFVIWVTTIPYIGPEEVGNDSWLGHGENRKELSEFIAQTIGEGPQNLLAVSADAHMLAFDDGTNTYYGSETKMAPSFPVLQSGPLDRVGSAKGGPFTDGCYSVRSQHNHQFSTIQFEMPEDNATEACMNIHAYKVHEFNSEEELVFSKRLCGAFFSPSQTGVREGTCKIDTYATTQAVVFGLAAACLAIGCLAAGYWFGWCCRKTAWIVAMVAGAWVVTLLIGVGLPFSGEIRIWLLVPISSIELGQIFVMDAWIAYSGHAAVKNPS